MRLKILVALLTSGAAASAAQFPLVDTGALMFGDVETITTHNEDTLPDLARRYGLGYEEILRANPGVDTWLPGEGTPVVIPGQRLLPAGPREGSSTLTMVPRPGSLASSKCAPMWLARSFMPTRP